MVSILAQELFYSRVEAAYSPKNSSGYQIVYYSPGLDRDALDKLESRLSCFQAEDVDVRFQYFHVNGGVALTASRVIDDVDTRITDRSGRRGAFVAHAYIISHEDFMQVENHPFAFFDNESLFLLTPQEMIQAQKAGASARELELTPPSTLDYAALHFDVGEWAIDDFKRIAALAAGAQTIVSARKSVLIKSDDELITGDLLRLIFALLPVEARPDCTFDTYTAGCLPMTGVYWAMVQPQRATNANFSSILLDRCRVDFAPGVSGDTRLQFEAEVMFKALRQAQGYDKE